MRECYACSGKGELFHLGRSICRKCFLRNMEKRVKKELGRERLGKGERVLVVGELEKVLLEKAVKGMPLRVTFRKRMPKDTKGYERVVYGRTMDEVEEEFLEGLFEGKLRKRGKGKVFNILEPLTEEEAKKYAKLRGVEFTGERRREGKGGERGKGRKEGGKRRGKENEGKGRGKEKNGKGRNFLEGLKEFKELRYNLLKNVREIREKL